MIIGRALDSTGPDAKFRAARLRMLSVADYGPGPRTVC
jgi:hypothetical protein